jgi:hypothetical protein
MFATSGLGAPSAAVLRPYLPSSRKTHDGIISPERASSPVHEVPSRHGTAPAPLVHVNSSPFFTNSQKQSSRDWSFDVRLFIYTFTPCNLSNHNPSLSTGKLFSKYLVLLSISQPEYALLFQSPSSIRVLPPAAGLRLFRRN